MMAKRPDGRYQSANEVVAALEPFAHDGDIAAGLPAGFSNTSTAGKPAAISRRVAVAVALGLAAVVALVVAQVVVVRDKDGKEVARVTVPDGGSVTVTAGPAADVTVTAEPFRLLPIETRSQVAAPSPIPDEREDEAGALSRVWDREHDEHVARQLLRRVEVDFAPVTWAAFRRQVFDGICETDAAAELGLSVNAALIAKSRVLSRPRTVATGLIPS